MAKRQRNAGIDAKGGPLKRNHADDVRYSRAGDDFHILWTARRALRLLDNRTGLVAVSVEGISEEEERDKKTSTQAGLLVVDTTEYYGAQTLEKASGVIYSQLKYSTQRSRVVCKTADLSPTLKQFFSRYIDLRSKLGSKRLATRIRFQFITNRPLDEKLARGLKTVGTNPAAALRDLKPLQRSLGASKADLTAFLARLSIQAGEAPRTEQTEALHSESTALQAHLDSGSVAKMKELVRSKTLPEAANNKTITRASLLNALGFIERELFPAPPLVEAPSRLVPRKQDPAIVKEVIRSTWPTVIHATGGIGKSVLAQNLGRLMPAGSVVIVFDGFAGGSYRSPSEPRHLHDRGLVQIANSLAQMGLCDILLPTTGPPDAYLRSFRRRLMQAVSAVRKRSPESLVVIALDAADNSVMAAKTRGDKTFVLDLLAERPPDGCRIVALARTERLDFLDLPSTATRAELAAFDEEETAAHLRAHFPEATQDQVRRFRRLTDANPRVQANALTAASDLQSLMGGLGPRVTTTERLIERQLEDALDKVRREHSGTPADVQRLCQALAVLPPIVPISTLAKAAQLPVSAIRSFAADFAGGRPLIIIGEALQFRDEPVETWFQRQFIPGRQQYVKIVNALEPTSGSDGYIASALPQLLYGAKQYQRLIELALAAPPFKSSDPVEQRQVALSRSQFALKAAISQGKLSDAAKLMLRAGDEAAADERQSGFLMDNGDLVADLAGSTRVFEFVFRKRAWRISDTGYIRCADMLAHDPINRDEARRFLSSAMQWLTDWATAGDRSQERMEDDRILSYASTICALRGPDAAAEFLGRWRQPAISLRVGMILSRRLLEHSDVTAVHALLKASTKNIHLQLGVIAELHRRYSLVDKGVLELAARRTLRLKPKDIYDQLGQNPYPGAIVCLAEAAVRAGVSRSIIAKLLKRFMPRHDRVLGRWDRGRDEVFRFTVLDRLIKGLDPVLADLTPASLKPGHNGRERDDETRFARVYGTLLPWYRLRGLAVLGRIKSKDWKKAELNAKASIQKSDYTNLEREDRGVLNEIPLLWADALGFSGLASKSRLSAVRDWILECKATFTSTLIDFAGVAAALGIGDLAIALLSRAKDQILAEHSEARSRANDLARIARAVLPASKDEAKAYFKLALEVIDRLGDDVYGRVFCLAGLADAAGRSGRPDNELAYRLSRSIELLEAHNNHKFPWHEGAEAIAALSEPSALAICARWRDREKVSVGSSLVPITTRLLESGALRPSTAAALHALAGWWSLRESAPHFFDRAADNSQRQIILEYLVRDIEFESTDNADWVNALTAQCRKYGLTSDRLTDRQRFAKAQGGTSHTAAPFDSGLKVKAVDWAEVFRGCDLKAVEGINKALTQARQHDAHWRFEHLAARMVRRVPMADRVAFIGAIPKSSVDPWNAVTLLEAALTAWSGSLAVEAAAKDAARALLTQAPLNFAQRALGEEMLARVVRLTGMTEQETFRLLVSCIGDHADQVSSSSWFHLASEVSRACLPPSQAKDVLSFALDRLAPYLKPTDGDGPWVPRLQPPGDLNSAVAGYIYAALASPYAKTRWLGAHAVRRLCRLNEQPIIKPLLALLDEPDLPAFHDARLPFYIWNARLFLFIALARAAEESPATLKPHIRKIVDWALNREPHVLIRHFAACAALNIERATPGLLAPADVRRLTNVNASSIAPKPPPTGKRIGWQHEDWKRSRVFGMHLDEDWLGPLAETFNLRGSIVARRMDRWITKTWNVKHSGAWRDEPRAGFFRDGMRTFSDHGSLPQADRYSFYLGYHALMCAAGELLQITPTTVKSGYIDRTWPTWLSNQTLTRPDGHWISDRRDFDPLRRPRANPRRVPPSHDSSDHWRWSILADDFDNELGIDRTGRCAALTVWSNWSDSTYSKRESVGITSALVSPKSSLALLRAAQTADCFQDCRIPPEFDSLQIKEPDFTLRGWILSPDKAEPGLDAHDPMANSVRWPPIRPGRLVRRLWQLSSDQEQRVWSFRQREVMRTLVWGSTGGRHDRDPAGFYGVRMTANPKFLLSVLRRLESDLIIEVEIDRENEIEKRKGFDAAYYRHRLYTRLYVLKASGELHTLYGHRRLRPEADR